MADNDHFYGLRWSTAANGAPCPHPLRKGISSGYDPQDDNANSVDLNIGDPVKLAADGDIELAVLGDAVYGVIVGFEYRYNAAQGVNEPTSTWPNQNAWGTNEENRDYALVIPASWGIWECDADDKVTATTKAAYHALQGSNVNVAVPGNTSQTSADPYIDISTVDTTESLVWRIHSISRTENNRDYSGLNVKLWLQVNNSQEPGFPATRVAGV